MIDKKTAFQLEAMATKCLPIIERLIKEVDDEFAENNENREAILFCAAYLQAFCRISVLKYESIALRRFREAMETIENTMVKALEAKGKW